MTSKRPSSAATIDIDAGIDDVFAVLSDPYSYADWVVGSDKVRTADADWPAAGSEFKHVVGVWPLKSHDHTVVEEVNSPNHLRLRVKARPFITGHVWLELAKRGAGTHVEMYEGAADPLSRLLINRATQPLVKARNAVALRRLRDMAEGTRPIPARREAQD